MQAHPIMLFCFLRLLAAARYRQLHVRTSEHTFLRAEDSAISRRCRKFSDILRMPPPAKGTFQPDSVLSVCIGFHPSRRFQAIRAASYGSTAHRLSSPPEPACSVCCPMNHNFHMEIMAHGTRLGVTPSMCDVLKCWYSVVKMLGRKCLDSPHYALGTTRGTHNHFFSKSKIL